MAILLSMLVERFPNFVTEIGFFVAVSVEFRHHEKHVKEYLLTSDCRSAFGSHRITTLAEKAAIEGIERHKGEPVHQTDTIHIAGSMKMYEFPTKTALSTACLGLDLDHDARLGFSTAVQVKTTPYPQPCWSMPFLLSTYSLEYGNNTNRQQTGTVTYCGWMLHERLEGLAWPQIIEAGPHAKPT